MFKTFFIYLMLLPASYASNAGTIFEGFYRLEKEGRHNGYAIQRLYRDPKTSRLTLTTYIRTLQNGREVSESFKAEAKTGTASPVASSYKGSVPGMPARIQATFNSSAATDSVDFYGRDPKSAKVTRRAMHPALLSSMVFFAADLAKLHVDKNYGYLAFSEERGRTSLGILRLIDEKTVSGQRVLHIEDDFFGQRIENFLAENGEPLGARNLAEKALIRWVPKLESAVGSLKFPKDEVVSLFGGLPKGQANSWAGLQGFDSSSVIGGFAKPVFNPRMNFAERKASMASMPVKSL